MLHFQTKRVSGAAVRLKSCSAPRIRLICFPYAGGGSAAFAEWGRFVEDSVELVAVTLPGREARFAEPPVESVGDAAHDIGEGIAALLDRPFVFFGHSLGALVAFETTRWLRRTGLGEPSLLFVSGAAAPHLPIKPRNVHRLPDAEFISELRRFNGTPEEILDNADLMALLLPAVRADFAAFENYTFAKECPLSCPLVTFAGNSDKYALPDDVHEWTQQTTGPVASFVFPGDHFFLKSQQNDVIRTVNRCVAELDSAA
jgi:medium-chain acyl-[acyl-carrier-protein] hydrolase